ncbi:FkbM family methyltransferase, partial [Streptomyces sp. NPDC059627]
GDLRVGCSGKVLCGGSTLAGGAAPDAQQKRIRLLTLDEVFAETPLDLVKIDVEGHEMSVLRGARRVLRRDRPTLVMEALVDADLGDLIAEFEPLGYDVHWIAEHDGSLVHWKEPRPPHTRNLLFTPQA